MSDLKSTLTNEIEKVISSSEFQGRLLSLLASSPVPVMTKRKFARETGLDEFSTNEHGDGVVQKFVENKFIPSVKFGRHRMIDLDGLRIQIANTRGE